MIKRADEGAEQLSKSDIKLFTGIVALDLSAFTIDNKWNIGSTKKEIKKNITGTLINCKEIIHKKCSKLNKLAKQNIIAGLTLKLSVPYIPELGKPGFYVIMVNGYYTYNKILKEMYFLISKNLLMKKLISDVYILKHNFLAFQKNKKLQFRPMLPNLDRKL